MKKQSFGIILAAVLGAGSLFSAVIPGTDALFTTALPGTGAVTVQAEASNSFGGSGSEEDDSYQDFAASEFSLVLDEADLLTDEEESQLLDKLEAITGEYNLEVAVATVESKDGNEMNYFTDHFFDENGYGTGENHDGILFMVSIDDREWHITTHGYGMTAFNDDGLAYLKENVEPLLKDENFYGAFDTYADLCQDLLEMAANGEPYTEPFSPIWILISLGIGLVLAFLCTMGMRAQLKSVRTQDSAVDYVRQGSMALTRSNDIFLYHTVTKTAKPKDSDSSLAAQTAITEVQAEASKKISSCRIALRQVASNDTSPSAAVRFCLVIGNSNSIFYYNIKKELDSYIVNKYT